MAARMLLADNDPQIAGVLTQVLGAEGYVVQLALDGPATLDLAAKWRPDLLLLELHLPRLDGQEVCRRIRTWSQLPIIVLSSCTSDDAKVTLLDLGADDYVTKPFSPRELLARIRVRLRHGARLQPHSGAVATFGHLRIDHARRLVTAHGRALRLTPTEYNLLILLSGHAGKVLTHGMILRAIWGPQTTQDLNALRVFITQLRRKVEADPAHPTLILTEPGVGYRFRLPDA